MLELGQQEENEQKDSVGDSSLSLGVGRAATHSNSLSELEKRNISQDTALYSPACTSFWKVLVYILGKAR